MKTMRNLKKITLLLLIQCLALGTFAQQTVIKEAETAYTEEAYGKAAELYEKVLKESGESPEIYYNLGNDY